LVDYLFNQTPKQVKASMEANIKRYKKMNENRINLLKML